MHDSPARRQLGLRDCYGMIATTICWLLLSAALAVASLKFLSLRLAAESFVSILCGPFAFLSTPRPMQSATLIIMFFCVGSVLLHLTVRSIETAIIACLGISFWFFFGMALTFVGV